MPRSIVTASIAAVAQLFIGSDERQAFPFQSTRVLGLQLVQFRPPGINLRPGLRCAVIDELGRPGSDDLAHRIAR